MPRTALLKLLAIAAGVPIIATVFLMVLSIGSGTSDDGQADQHRPQDFKLADLPDPAAVPIPKREDGSHDYLAWLNQIAGHGVTPENNEFALTLQVMDFSTDDEKHVEQYRKELESRGYTWPQSFQRFEVDYAALNELVEAGERPWEPDRFPKAHAALNDSAAALAIFVEAGERSRSFMPLVTEDGDYMGEGLWPARSTYRLAHRCLMARAMLSAANDQWTDCRRDIIASMRLGRLVTQQPSVIDGLVGLSLASGADTSLRRLIEHEMLDGPTAQSFLQAMRQLPPDVPLSRAIRSSDLAMTLSAVNRARDARTLRELYNDANNGIGAVLTNRTQKHLDDVLPDHIDPAIPALDLQAIHRAAVEHYNQIAKAWEIDDFAAAVKHLDDIYARIDRQSKRFTEVQARLIAHETGEPVERPSDGELREALAATLATLFSPAYDAAYKAWTRYHANHAITLTALSLAIHHHKRGQYPASLAALPDAAQREAVDPYTGKPLIYRRTADGYLLYSVGPNGQDDTAKQDNDRINFDDDLGIQVPRAQENQQPAED